jgi:L-threonylcarbamoyladenylate synthase
MEMLSTSDTDLAKAAAALAVGLLVAFPTETVYGLGADAFNQSALARIFEVKSRPRFDPLIIHIAALETLWRIADKPSLSKAAVERLSVLVEKLWPGPLTLILPKRGEVPDLATSALATVAIRFPSHPVAQKIIRLSTGAIAAPSANLFGRLSPTRAAHVKAQLGDKVDYIVDGGKTTVGLESTVLDLSGEVPRILRQGGTEREKIEALIGPVEQQSCDSPSEAPLSPGQLKSHYAPRTPLVICKRGEMDATPFASGEGRLYFSHPKIEGILTDRARVLSETGNVTEAATNFFDCLHELDSMGLDFIRAEEAPASGLGEAINDRLRRATH